MSTFVFHPFYTYFFVRILSKMLHTNIHMQFNVENLSTLQDQVLVLKSQGNRIQSILLPLTFSMHSYHLEMYTTYVVIWYMSHVSIYIEANTTDYIFLMF